MEKKKIMLLIAGIFTLLYVGMNIALSVLTNTLVSDNNYLNIFYLVFFSLLIIGSVFFIYASISKKDMNKFKVPIFIFSIVMFINNIVSGILGFIVCSKLSKKKKRELPKLDIKMNRKWYVYLIAFILAMVVIFVIPELKLSIAVKYVSYGVLFLLLLIVFFKDLKRDIKYFFKYFREYNSYILKYYLYSLLTLIIVTVSIRLTVHVDNATNQVNLMEQFKQFPLLIAVLSIIYAPFIEELLFRGIIRKFINNKWIFIIVSGLLFGAAHVIDDFKSVGELLYIFVYGSLGCYMAALYYKTNNIFTNMFFHFLQNSLAIIAIILLNYFIH